MKVSAFVATSLDGFIARTNGSLDWLERVAGDDYGYQAFFDSVDALVIGRKTYEQALRMDPWPYGFKRVLVLSRGYVEIPQNLVRFVEYTQYPPTSLCNSLAQVGIKHLYVDGGQTIQSFLSAGLLSEMTINRIPVLLGAGVPLFGDIGRDISASVLGSQHYAGNVIQTRYAFSKRG